MVFGNRGDDAATGVAFTRDPATGEKLLYGEFLVNAQGEDVVAGIRTPQPISKIVRERQGGKKPSMEEAMPAAYAELKAHRRAARSSITATCRTWNSPCRKASSSCSRPAPANAPPRRRCKSPSTWWARG